MPEPQTLIVQSRQNGRVKALRAALAQPLRLGEQGLVGIEGMHLLEEAMRAGIKVDTVFVRAGEERSLPRALTAPVVSVADGLLRAAVSTEAPQGVAALVRAPAFALEQVFTPAPALVVVVAGLQDPGNMGTIVRSAEAFGATGVIALPGTVSLWNPKCVRASAGSVFRVPVVAASVVGAQAALAGRGLRLLATVVSSGVSASAMDFAQPCALWIGNEGAGLPREQVELCDAQITIPCLAVESLNAAVATSVLLYEAARQRQARGLP